MTLKEAYISDNLLHQSDFLTFPLKNNSLLPATSVLSQWPNLMIYNTTASLDKLTCADYVDFGKYQDRRGWFSWSKNGSNYLDVNL